MKAVEKLGSEAAGSKELYSWKIQKSRNHKKKNSVEDSKICNLQRAVKD